MSEYLTGEITSIPEKRLHSEITNRFWAFKAWMDGIAERHHKETVIPGMKL